MELNRQRHKGWRFAHRVPLDRHPRCWRLADVECPRAWSAGVRLKRWSEADRDTVASALIKGPVCVMYVCVCTHANAKQLMRRAAWRGEWADGGSKLTVSPVAATIRLAGRRNRPSRAQSSAGMSLTMDQRAACAWLLRGYVPGFGQPRICRGPKTVGRNVIVLGPRCITSIFLLMNFILLMEILFP